MKRQIPFWAGLLVIIVAAVIAGFVVYGAYANTAKSLERERFMTISTPIIVTSTTNVSNASSSSQPSVAISQNAFTSPDGKWIASAGTGIGNNFPTDTETLGELQITSSDGSISKFFSAAQLGVSSTCDCSVSILGWGKGVLWLENDSDEEGPIISFIKINTVDWSVTSYPSNIYDISYRGTINFNIGKFIETDLPWGPNSDEENPAQDTNTYSVSIYDMQTGLSQIIETTTAEIAAPMQASFGLDLKWINDNTLQYYNFNLGGLATTTVSN